jgi:hypothetical protein
VSQFALVKLIETKLKTWADSQDIPIAFEAVTFEPPAAGIYARTFHVPATTTGAFVEGGHKAFTGFYQVSIVGVKGKGAAPMRELAETLGRALPQNLVLRRGTFAVQITTPLSEGPLIEDTGGQTARVTLPCRFDYRADTVS